MSRMLKADKNFVPCRVDDGDELFQNGIFEFNVTRILEHIAKCPEDIALGLSHRNCSIKNTAV